MLILSYCIPQDLMYENARKSAEILQNEGIKPVSQIQGKQIDNFTTALMINEAYYPVQSPLLDSLAVPNSQTDVNQITNLISSLDGEYKQTPYYRYWHGYLVYLKPLLCFFNLYEIRLLFQTCIVLLLIAVFYAFSHRLGKMGVVFGSLLAFSFLVFGSADAIVALPMFPSFALSLLGAIFVLRGKTTPFILAIGFMVLGALTVYFDYLDNPILTLGIPLACLLLRHAAENKNGFRDIAKQIGICSLFWLLGYGGIWVAKWALASAVLGQNVFSNALSAITTRAGMSTDAANVDSSSLGALLFNWGYMGSVRWLFVVIVICVIIGIAFACIRTFSGKSEQSRKIFAQTIGLVIGLVVVASMPYIWIVVLSEHSSVHYWFTYRDQIVSLFCLLACAVVLFRQEVLKTENHELTA